MNDTPETWLTAAQCAARTGLTVRALRVYEYQGLIAPGRSAAGWRRYGSHELVRLNQISLLKVLGLTLKQIRDLMRRPAAPTLLQLLDLQLATWKDRREEAERGLLAAEAAIQILKSGQPLSIEDLCALIRSLEMTSSLAPAEILDPEDASTTQPGRLEAYVGCYLRNRALGVTTITRGDGRLILEPIGQPARELEQTGEADFALPMFDLALCFEQLQQGVAQRLVIWNRGVPVSLTRIDAATAQDILQGVAERIRAQKPSPGSEEALRKILDASRAGTPNSDLLSPEFAQVARSLAPHWQILGQYFGPIVSMRFVRVTEQGWDVYEVRHQNDLNQYRIALGDDGKVYGFSEASQTADKRALF